eukprot:1422953-Lingulodinium_polyedra.AAC.1
MQAGLPVQLGDCCTPGLAAAVALSPATCMTSGDDSCGAASHGESVLSSTPTSVASSSAASSATASGSQSSSCSARARSSSSSSPTSCFPLHAM